MKILNLCELNDDIIDELNISTNYEDIKGIEYVVTKRDTSVSDIINGTSNTLHIYKLNIEGSSYKLIFSDNDNTLVIINFFPFHQNKKEYEINNKLNECEVIHFV